MEGATPRATGILGGTRTSWSFSRLVDLPPQELLLRYERPWAEPPPELPREKFLQPGTLAALRELALRQVARQVDEDLRRSLRSGPVAGPWPAAERLLVCVGPSPLSERLVRAAHRLADALSADGLALHVDTGELAPAERDRVARHLEPGVGYRLRVLDADASQTSL